VPRKTNESHQRDAFDRLEYYVARTVILAFALHTALKIVAWLCRDIFSP